MEKKYIIIGAVLLLLLISAGAALFFSGGGEKQNNEQIEITWWKTFEESDNVSEMISDFESANENIRINFVKKDAATYENELVTAIASGRGPDIFTIHNNWLTKHIEIIAPIPDSVMNLRNFRDNFVDVAFTDFVKDNKIYAVPLAVDVLALYYNKDILGSSAISVPPSTWPELVSDVQKITRVGSDGVFTRSGVALGTGPNINRAVDILTLLMLQNGTKFYTDDLTSAAFDQIQSSDGSSDGYNPGDTALAFYTQFANPAKTSYTWNSRSDFSIDAFTQGQVGMMISYQYMQPVLKARAPNLNWGVAAVPQISNETTKINFANYWGESISKNSPNQLAAANFLNFITSRDQLAKYYTKTRRVSARKDLLQTQLPDAELGVFAEAALTARSVYKKDANVYESVFLGMINDVILNNFETDQALRNGVLQINLNLQR